LRKGTALFLALITLVAVAGAWLTGYAEKRLPKPGVTSFARKQMEKPLSHVIVTLRGRPKTVAQDVWTASRARTLTVNYNLDVRWQIPTFSMISGTIPSRNVPAVSRLDWVEAVSKDWLAELSGPQLGKGLRGLTLDEVRERAGFRELWEKRGKGEGMRVAVVDSGKPSPGVLKVAKAYTVLGDKMDRYGHSCIQSDAYVYTSRGLERIDRLYERINAKERTKPDGSFYKPVKENVWTIGFGVGGNLTEPEQEIVDTIREKGEISVRDLKDSVDVEALGTYLGILSRKQVIERTNDGWRLTDIGTAYCDMEKGVRRTRVKAVHKIPYHGKAIKVEAGTGTWITTPWHPFLVKDRRHGTVRYVKAKNLNPDQSNYFLVQPRESISLTDEHLNENIAYLIGLYLAEGNAWRKKYTTYSKFNLHSEELDKILSFIKKAGLNAWKSEDKRGNGGYVETTGITDYLKNYGIIDDNSLEKKIPPELSRKPKDVLFPLIAGIIDGDGSFDSNRPRVRIRTSSRKFAKQLTNLLTAMGFDARITEETTRERTVKGRTIKGGKPTWLVSVIGHPYLRLCRKIGPYLKLKEPKVGEAGYKHEGLWIKNVEEVDYDGYLYDLTTGTNNYLAGKKGMTFIHNTAVCWVYSKLAPEAEIVTYKALGARGLGRISDVLKALERIANLPEGEKPDLINLSLGVPPAIVSPLSIAADTLDSRFNIPVVCAAGNAGPASPSVMQPATGSETVCIGALNAKGEVATFSSRGRAVDTATYGVVYSYWGGEGIRKVVGTSIASPIWGAAYLDWLSGIRGSNIDDRRMAALSSVDIGPEGWDPASGYGKLSGGRLAGTSPVLEAPIYVRYAPLFALVIFFVLIVAFLIRRR